jgi:hypothetical protein
MAAENKIYYISRANYEALYDGGAKDGTVTKAGASYGWDASAYYVLSPELYGTGISSSNGVVTIVTANAQSLGGVKVGFVTTGTNYAVQLDSDGNAFVSVPSESGIATEVSARKEAVNTLQSSLQSQIDTINATQNVVDIVGTKALLDAYATSNLQSGDKIEVLADENNGGANTIYNWDGAAWSLIGQKGPFYTKTESDTKYATNTDLTTAKSSATTINSYDVTIAVASWTTVTATDSSGTSNTYYKYDYAISGLLTTDELEYAAIDVLTSGAFSLGREIQAECGISAQISTAGYITFYAIYDIPSSAVSFHCIVTRKGI